MSNKNSEQKKELSLQGGWFDRIVTTFETGVMLGTYVLLIAIIGEETMRRILTGGQWLGGPEVALYAFVWLSWFSMAHNIHNDRHLSFTEFRNRMGRRLRAGFEIFDCALWIGLGVIIIVTSYDVIARQINYAQVVFGTNIPLAAATIAVPVGWSLTIIRILQRLRIIAITGEPPKISHIVVEVA